MMRFFFFFFSFLLFFLIFLNLYFDFVCDAHVVIPEAVRLDVRLTMTTTPKNDEQNGNDADSKNNAETVD